MKGQIGDGVSLEETVLQELKMVTDQVNNERKTRKIGLL